MKDKALTDIEDKIKNDFAAGNFNIGDATDPNSVAGMAMAFLKGVASAAQESSKVVGHSVDLSTLVRFESGEKHLYEQLFVRSSKPDLMTGVEALQALNNHYAVRRSCWEIGLYVFKSVGGRPFGSYDYGLTNPEDFKIMWRYEYGAAPSEPVEATHFLHDDWERVLVGIQDTMYYNSGNL